MCVCVCRKCLYILYIYVLPVTISICICTIHIGESDIFEICGYLHGLDKRSIFSLGLCLGLNYAKVEDMLQSPTYQEDIIAAWIQRQDQVLQKSGAPTWQTLVKALKNPQVGQGGIANDISKAKNIHTSFSTESGTCIHFL